jgi:predicted dehydrogenase
LYRTFQSTITDDEYSDFSVETDLAAALAHQPDAVIVSNPTSLHLDVAIPAAEAGCHLFLEKPVSHSMENIEELKAAVKRGGGNVLVGFQFRYHPGLRQLANLLDGKVIGRPLSVRAHWGEYLPGWHPWEDYKKGYSAREDLGGGVTLTLSHPLDYLRWLIGDVSDLWAFTGNKSDLNLQVDDVAEIGLRFESGALGTVHLNYIQRPPSHRLEIVGTLGTLRWNNEDGAVHVYRAATQEWELFAAPNDLDRNTLFLDQMAHFIDVIRGDKPVCTLGDGIRTLELALAAHESALQGKVIKIGGVSAIKGK